MQPISVEMRIGVDVEQQQSKVESLEAYVTQVDRVIFLVLEMLESLRIVLSTRDEMKLLHIDVELQSLSQLHSEVSRIRAAFDNMDEIEKKQVKRNQYIHAARYVTIAEKITTVGGVTMLMWVPFAKDTKAVLIADLAFFASSVLFANIKDTIHCIGMQYREFDCKSVNVA